MYASKSLVVHHIYQQEAVLEYISVSIMKNKQTNENNKKKHEAKLTMAHCSRRQGYRMNKQAKTLNARRLSIKQYKLAVLNVGRKYKYLQGLLQK